MGSEFAIRWGIPDGDKPLEEQPISRLFGLASRLIGMVSHRMLEQHGISGAGLAVLQVLGSEDGLKSTEVANRIWTTPATLSTVVNTLERDGYVERRRESHDRRVVRLVLTEHGRTSLDNARQDVSGQYSELFDYIDPADEPAIRRFLLGSIERFSAVVRAETLGPLARRIAETEQADSDTDPDQPGDSGGPETRPAKKRGLQP